MIGFLEANGLIIFSLTYIILIYFFDWVYDNPVLTFEQLSKDIPSEDKEEEEND